MTTTVRTPPPPRIPSRSPRGSVPTWVWWVIGVLAVLLVTAFILLSAAALFGAGSRPEPPGVVHDPGNAQPQGSRALYRVLDEHGVQVREVEGIDEFSEAPRPDSDTTVVVSSSSRFNPATAQQFRDRTRDAARVVVVAPDEPTLSRLGLPVVAVFGSPRPGGVSAGCSTREISPTDRITAQYSGYATSEPSAIRCFTAGEASNLIILPATTDRPETVVVSGDAFTNDNLPLYDNAGVAVRVLGSTDELLWYLPRVTDSAAERESSDSDIPAALGPLIVLTAVAVLALMLWRGRRFGALVTEPLPAVVKAIETTQARGRMYRRAGADARAAATLRIRTLTSIAMYLGLPFDAGRATDELARPDQDLQTAPPMSDAESVQAIVAAVAEITRRDRADIHALLAGPLPGDPAGLVLFVRELTDLEQEVRSTP